MEHIRQEFNLTDRLEKAAEFYGYSSRRLRDQVIKGKVLGITHEPGRGLVFYSSGNSGNYKMLGPVPDFPQNFILPPRTVHVAREISSGPVSGLIYQGQFIQKQHPEVKLTTEPGCSGVIVKLYPRRTE